MYGVDKNAAAVELAKLSLWLETLSGEKPFTFLDHVLRHGDSLVGLDVEQVRAFHWKPEAQSQTVAVLVDAALAVFVERGYAGRITLSHDSCCVFHWAPQALLDQAAPDWNMTHITNTIIPLLRKNGVSDAAIHQMTVRNPRRLFEMNAPY